MDHKTVKRLEERIEDAIAEVFAAMGRSQLPVLPDRHIVHLMAKAAVTVYEAVVDNQRVDEEA